MLGSLIPQDYYSIVFLCVAYYEICILLLLEDKGKAKPNSASQQSSTEAGPFLPKPGVAAVAPVTPASASKSTNGASNAVPESEEEKAKKLLYCSLCKVAVNSLSQLEAHNTGEYAYSESQLRVVVFKIQCNKLVFQHCGSHASLKSLLVKACSGKLQKHFCE